MVAVRAYSWWDCVYPKLRDHGVAYVLERETHTKTESDLRLLLSNPTSGHSVTVTVHFMAPGTASIYGNGFIYGMHASESSLRSIHSLDRVCLRFGLSLDGFAECDKTNEVLSM